MVESKQRSGDKHHPQGLFAWKSAVLNGSLIFAVPEIIIIVLTFCSNIRKTKVFIIQLIATEIISQHFLLNYPTLAEQNYRWKNPVSSLTILYEKSNVTI